MNYHITVTIISSLLILFGVLGSILPVLPGPPIALIGLLIYGWFTKFQTASVFWVVFFAGLTLLTLLFDVFAPALVAKGFKASKYGAWGAVVGGIIGLLTMGPPGAFVGPFIGAFAGEYYNTYNSQQALRSAWGAFVGIMIGSLFKFVVTLSIMIYFIAAVIRLY